MSRLRFDITDRRDVACLVDVFYDRVRDDALLGPIFDDVAHVDWATHLPRMYDFWESVLFGRATFKGTPLIAHRALARKTSLTGTEFEHWVALFQTTVDDLFKGAIDLPVARRTSDAFVNVDTVIEVDEVGQIVHACPLNRLAGAEAVADWFEERTVRENLGMAVHARLGGWNPGERRILD
jgi:hemoglobin